MAYKFAFILEISTIITGIMWVICFLKRTKVNKYIINEIKHNNKSLLNDNKILTLQNYISMLMEQCSSIFPILLFVFILRSFICEPFQIPSGSMMPTLLVGDLILVNKFSYGIKDPITNKTLIPIGHPQRGDIVVFRYPLDNTLNYVKRVIAIPGDKIIYNPISKKIIIYKNFNNKNKFNHKIPIFYKKILNYKLIKILDFNKNVIFQEKILDNKINNFDSNFSTDILNETICNNSHNILLIPGQYDSIKNYYRQYKNLLLTEWIVPSGKYFVMGDYRDNSFDSRYWGFVSEQNLVGKVKMVWMSFEKKENEWPTGLRLNHIGFVH